MNKGNEKDTMVWCGNEFVSKHHLEQYNRDLDEAEAQIERGEFVTHENVLKEFEIWKTGMLQRLSGPLRP